MVKTQIQELTRQEKGEEIAQRFNLTKTSYGWKVPSQSKNGYYNVDMGKQECNCPDCKYRNEKCKHIYAVEFYMKQEISQQGQVLTTKGMKITYSQEWKAYDKAQTNEKILFYGLLNDLTKHIEEPEYSFGRPKIPLNELIFSSVLKVYTTFSLRRFISDLQIAHERGYIHQKPCYSSIGHFMQRKDLTPILKELIKFSSLPLKSVESSFAIDSSGFSTSRFARYFDYKHNKDTKYRIWLKANLMSGTKTNIVTSCEITEGYRNDLKSLPKLVKETSKNFNMNEIIGDKAYSSRKALALIGRTGATPYIPFKSKTRGYAKEIILEKK